MQSIVSAAEFGESLHMESEKTSKTIIYPAGIYLLKVNNRNTRTWCEICSKLTIKTPERRQWRHERVKMD